MLLIGLILTVLLGAVHVLTPPNPDSAIFDYMGWRVLAGDRLYVDVIEQNWPGAVWLHALSTALFGNTWWSFRLFDYLLMLQASAALFWMGSRSGLRWTGWISGLLYPLMYLTSSPWMSGQRDALVAHLLVGGSALYVALRGQWRGLGMVMFGLICALVVMIRPTYLLFPALVVLLELSAHLVKGRSIGPFLKGASFAAAAFAISLLVVAVQGARNGGLAGWWDAAIVYNLSVYSGSAGISTYTATVVALFKSWHWYLVFATIGSALWWRTGDRWVWSISISLAVTCLVSFLVQGKAFGYHLVGLLPILALYVGHLIAWAVNTLQERKPGLLLIVAMLLISTAVAGSALKLRSVSSQFQVLAGSQKRDAHLARSEFDFEGMNMKDLMNVSHHIRAHTRREDTVLVWNRGVWINFLSERKMPIPFATVGALAELSNGTEGLADRWLGILNRALECTPPAYIVLGDERGWLNGMHARVDTPLQLLESDRAVLNTLRAAYALEVSVGGAQLWRRLSSESTICAIGHDQ